VPKINVDCLEFFRSRLAYVKELRMRYVLVSTALLFGASSSGGLAQTTAEKSIYNGPDAKEVLRVNRERLDALVRGDLATLDRVVGDDVTYTAPSGKVQSKPEIVADFESGAYKIGSIETDNEKVRVYGNTAVVNYRCMVNNYRYKGKDATGTYQCTTTYVKRNGQWQAVAQHMTRIEPSR
jgi:ketosteroid isomerase-like protein